MMAIQQKAMKNVQNTMYTTKMSHLVEPVMLIADSDGSRMTHEGIAQEEVHSFLKCTIYISNSS